MDGGATMMKKALIVIAVYVAFAFAWAEYESMVKPTPAEEQCDKNWDNPLYKSPLGYEESKEELHARCVRRFNDGWD